jgi:hypothetical protein
LREPSRALAGLYTFLRAEKIFTRCGAYGGLPWRGFARTWLKVRGPWALRAEARRSVAWLTMPSYEPELLTAISAAELAKEWIDNRVPKSTRRFARNEMRWMMQELAILCVKEAVAAQETADQLCDRLYNSHEILSTVWWFSAPEIAKKLWKEDENPTDEEQLKIDQAKCTLWKRHDPSRSFRDGWKSEHYVDFDKVELVISAIAPYLQSGWLRHPVLDWVFLDLLITQELCQFGEALKRDFLPGPRSEFTGEHAKYFKSEGKLEEMKKIEWNPTLERWNMLFWRRFGFPIGTIAVLFYVGWAGTAWIGTALYGFALAVWTLVGLVRFAKRMIRRGRGQLDPKLRPFQLWDKMYAVWRHLELPVINPTIVRKEMERTTAEGAVWHAAAWSLIDRVISVDPAVWVVEIKGSTV